MNGDKPSVFRCGACGREVIKSGHIWNHQLEEWDHDYVSHDVEPVYA